MVKTHTVETEDLRNPQNFPSAEVFKDAWIKSIPEHYLNHDGNLPRDIRHSVTDLLITIFRFIAEHEAEINVVDYMAIEHLRSFCNFLENIESHFQNNTDVSLEPGHKETKGNAAHSIKA